jgi:hypothetical protein
MLKHYGTVPAILFKNVLHDLMASEDKSYGIGKAVTLHLYSQLLYQSRV